jgi:hypothetical protein
MSLKLSRTLPGHIIRCAVVSCSAIEGLWDPLTPSECLLRRIPVGHEMVALGLGGNIAEACFLQLDVLTLTDHFQSANIS